MMRRPIPSASTREAPLPSVTLSDVASFGARGLTTVTIDGIVYDVTKVLTSHPGGAALVCAYNGRDVTGLFHAVHSNGAAMLANATLGVHALGRLVESSEPPLSVPRHRAGPHGRLLEYVKPTAVVPPGIDPRGGFGFPRRHDVLSGCVFGRYAALAAMPCSTAEERAAYCTAVVAFEAAATGCDVAREQQLTEALLVQAVRDVSDVDVAPLLSEFTFLVQRWVTGGTDIKQSLPLTLGVPWVELAARRGVKPVVTHDAINLCNWTLATPDTPSSDAAVGGGSGDGTVTFDDIKIVRVMTGNTQEQSWYKVHIAVEAAFAPVLHELHVWAVQGALLQAPRRHPRGAWALKLLGWLEAFLARVAVAQQHALVALRLMGPDVVDPRFFFHEFRLNLAGSADAAKFPNGLAIDKTAREPLRMQGGSGAQAPSIQALDVFLGVKHRRDVASFLTNNLEYMARWHRDYLRDVIEGQNVYDWLHYIETEHAADCGSDPCDDARKAAETMQQRLGGARAAIYRCIAWLERFRECHRRIVEQYVYDQIPRPATPADCAGAASDAGSDTPDGSDAAPVRGTGGSNPRVLLGSINDETRAAMREMCPFASGGAGSCPASPPTPPGVAGMWAR